MSSIFLLAWGGDFHHGRLLLLSHRRRLSSAHRISRSLQESYRLLQLPTEGHGGPEQVRDAYLRLAKLYNPDSGEPTADGEVFARIEAAYRAVLAHQRSEVRRRDAATEDDEAPGAALQHRRYLSYEGVGSGTPSQRERWYEQVRLDRAAEGVLSYREREHERAAAAAGGALVERDTRQRNRKIKITQAVERLVEDLIQESMARGDFRNLSGAGKPLNKFDYNPYADPVTHNLNRILIDNGYQPPWVAAQRDIREGAARIRGRLLEGRARLGDPMTPAEQNQWARLCGSVEEELGKLNKMVDDYNLIVPMLSMQTVHFGLSRETERARRGAERLRSDQLKLREAEREKRKEERKRANSRAKTLETKKSGLLAWMQSLLRY